MAIACEQNLMSPGIAREIAMTTSCLVSVIGVGDHAHNCLLVALCKVTEIRTAVRGDNALLGRCPSRVFQVLVLVAVPVLHGDAQILHVHPFHLAVPPILACEAETEIYHCCLESSKVNQLPRLCRLLHR